MITNPFQIFAPYQHRFTTYFFDRSDILSSDADLQRALPEAKIATLKQIHSDVIHNVSAPTSRMLEGDGITTNTVDLLLAVRMADCQLFVIYDPLHHACGALHAGWKGLVTGAIEECIAKMTQTWGSNPKDLLVGIAPSLCLTHSEFTDPVEELCGVDPQYFHGRHADLQAIANAHLQQAGITDDHIERMEGCTVCDPKRLWTYRGETREKVKEGHHNVLACVLH